MSSLPTRVLHLCIALTLSSYTSMAESPAYLHDPCASEQTNDLKGPFNYFLKPSDAIGFMDSPKAFQLTYDGAYNAYWGELTLWAGTPLKPLNSRSRTLEKGYLPVIGYGALVDEIEYRVQSFAAPVNLDPQGNLLGFFRLTATNAGKTSRRAAVGARVFGLEGAWRQPLFDRTKPFWWADRFMDQKAWLPWELWEPTTFLDNGEVHRTDSKHLIFRYETDKSPWKVITAAANMEPFEFSIQLAPGQSASVDVIMPFVPVADGRKEHIKEVADAHFDDYLKRSGDFWDKKINNGTMLEVPEQKVMDMHKASLMYDLMARDLGEDGKGLIQTVSDVQYNQFFSRDAAFIIHMYDTLGLSKVAAECIEHILLKDDKGNLTGLLATHPDAWGQALWTLAAHYRITGDLDFAKRVYLTVPGHVTKLEEECAKDKWGIWPVAEPYDNERIDGHYTGHSLWVLRGLKDAIDLAKALGKQDDIARFQKVYDGYESRFMKHLKEITDKTGGYMPPGLDDPLAGMDWENASGGVYPFGVISANDPMVSKTVKTVRDYAYQEGIMTYEHNAFKVLKSKEKSGTDWSKPEPTVIHHYETFQVLETLLALGMDREVITDFYSFLVHTGSTQTGFEYDVWAWRDRNFHNNYPPHGWCASRYNECFRNMLIREDTHGSVLHLASALSPVWVAAGKQVRVANAPTDFGNVSYTIDSTEDGATLSFGAKWRKAPESILFHIPWFLDLKSATIDGSAATVENRAVQIPADAKKIELKWTHNSKPDLSYRRGVELYVDQYWKIQRGETIPGFDSRWIFPE